MEGTLIKIKHIERQYFQYYIADDQFYEIAREQDFMSGTVTFDIYQQAPYQHIKHNDPLYREIVDKVKKEMEK